MMWNRFKPTRNQIFAMLLILSALALKLPPGFSNGLKHVVQAIGPFQHVAFSAAFRATEAVAGVDESVELTSLKTERDALHHAVMSLAGQIETLRRENAELMKLRENFIPPVLPLKRAQIVGRDIVASRDALLVARGRSSDVHQKDWVASRFFIDQGVTSGVDGGQVVLVREALLGRVEQVSPYMSRVQLLSDVDSHRVEVRIGAMVDDGPADGPRKRQIEMIDYVCSLRGRGRGQMIIEDVPYRYVQQSEASESGRLIRVGDTVFSASGQFGIPVPMVIGRISAIEENPKKRLVYDLLVEPVVSIDRLTEVYVIPAVPVGALTLAP